MKGDLYWDTERRNQGQIVEVKHPQIAGAAEGVEGPGEGLVLTVDHSDGSWQIDDRRYGVIIRGQGSDRIPSVWKAIGLRKTMRGVSSKD